MIRAPKYRPACAPLLKSPTWIHPIQGKDAMVVIAWAETRESNRTLLRGHAKCSPQYQMYLPLLYTGTTGSGIHLALTTVKYVLTLRISPLLFTSKSIIDLNRRSKDWTPD